MAAKTKKEGGQTGFYIAFYSEFFHTISTFFNYWKITAKMIGQLFLSVEM